MKKLTALLAASAAALTIGSANAAFVDLTKLETSPGAEDGVPASPSNPFEIDLGSITVVIRGIPTGVNNSEPAQSDAPCAPGGFLACDFDGLGIGNFNSGAPDDEVTFGSQAIEVTFKDSTGDNVAVDVTRLHFLDLFVAPDESDRESAVVDYYNTLGVGPADGTVDTPALFTRAVDNSGYVDNLGTLSAVARLVFYAGPGTDDGTADFALAGLDIDLNEITNPVPVPGALPLFLAGLGGLAAARRKRKQA